MEQKQNPKEDSLFHNGWALRRDIRKRLRAWKPQGWAAGLEKMTEIQRADYIIKKLGLDKSKYFSERDKWLLIEELKNKEYSSDPERYEARVLREILEQVIK